MNKNKETKKLSQNHNENDQIQNKNRELQKLVQNNKHFEFLSSGKIKCLLTNHEILPTLQEFNNYLNGKSYKNAVENDIDFLQFEPYIVQHKNDKNKLFCNLTRQNISKKKSVVLKHVNGKRYKYYLSKYLEEQAKLEQNENDEQIEDIQNELDELNNLINDDDSQQEQPKQEQPKQQQQQGILKNGKNKKNKKNQQQKQVKIDENKIEQEQQEQEVEEVQEQKQPNKISKKSKIQKKKQVTQKQ